MARAAEEEENYWPGFVDALSTIVMVVTFLLIILGVAIFAISTQVTKAVNDSRAEAEALAQTEAKMTASLDEKAAQAKQAEEKATAAAAALASAIAEKAKAEASEQAAKEQLAATAAASSPPSASDVALKLAEKTIADQAAQLERQKQAAAELVRQVATLNQAAAAAPTQDVSVDADNKLLINSRKAIDPAEISVTAAEEDATQQKLVTVKSADAVLTVRFDDRAIQLDDAGLAAAVAFVKSNAAALTGQKLTLWSFYDADALGVTQAKRSAYFRVLALRNAMLEAGLEQGDVDINVRPADAAPDIDTVKAFLQ